MSDISTSSLKTRPQALPAEINDWQRAIKVDRTLNDLVEEVHRGLVQNERYRKLLEAVWDEDAVEGSLAADNYLAAAMIRESAEKKGVADVANKKLATISKALGVVLRRYNADRKTRRQMVDGQIVPSNGSE
jgi:hypothetical protein